MPYLPNIFSDLPNHLPAERVETLLSAQHVRIERIVSMGHVSPEGFWYDQDADEWVLLVRGAARVRIEGEELLEMVAGSFLHLPARRRHRVEWTDPAQATVWVAVHFGVSA